MVTGLKRISLQDKKEFYDKLYRLNVFNKED